MIFQHLDNITPRQFNKQNWINNPFGVYFGFDITTNGLNQNITINHQSTGLIRPDPNGDGTLSNSLIQGGGVMPTGISFINAQIFTLPVTPNTSGNVRTDLVTIFFAEKDTEPFTELAVIILNGVDSIDDNRYVPIATIDVPNNFVTTDEIIVNRVEYKNSRKAVMEHMVNIFQTENTFNLPTYSEGNIFQKNNTVLNSSGTLTGVDVSKSYYFINEPSLTGIRALRNIVTENNHNLETIGKYRIIHIQSNNTLALFSIGNIITSDIYIMNPFGVATFIYDCEVDVYYLVNVSQGRTFATTKINAQVDGNNLIVSEAFEQTFFLNASGLTELNGISFTQLTGVTKTELANFTGYAFTIVLNNVQNNITLSTNLASNSNRSCFVVDAVLSEVTAINCKIDANGDLIHDIKASEVISDKTNTHIASYPSPSIQPNAGNPIKYFQINSNKGVLTGKMDITANYSESSPAAVIIRFDTALRGRYTSVHPCYILDNGNKNRVALLKITEGSSDVTLHFTQDVSNPATMDIYAEFYIV